MVQQRRLVFLSALILTVLLLQAVAPVNAVFGTTYRVYGYVVTEGTNPAVPVEGATVNIYSDMQGFLSSTGTNEDGYFSKYVTCQYVEQFRVEVIKTGYVTENKYKMLYGGTEVDMGTIELSPNAVDPPIPPIITVQSDTRSTPYRVTLAASLTWHYNPYISRNVWVEWSGESYPMTIEGGHYERTFDNLDPSKEYTYSIGAKEVWFDATYGYQREVSATSVGSVDAWLAPTIEGWSYKKSHVIQGSTGAGEGYQIQIRTEWGATPPEGDIGDTVHMNGKSRQDFADVKFLTGDEKVELPFWRQEKVDGQYAVFWVKMWQNLNNDATIWVYYGNKDAQPISASENSQNGENTFIAFDDFEDYTVGQAPKSEYGWVGNDDVFIQSNAGGRTGLGLKLDTALTTTSEGTSNDWGQIDADSIAIHYMWYCSRVVDRNGYTSIVGYDGTTAKTAVTTLWNGQSIDDRDWYTGSYYANYNPMFTYSAGIWYDIEEHVKSSYYHSVKDGYDLTAGTRNGGVDDFYRFSISTYQDNRHGAWFTQYDDFFVRKWVSSEPQQGVWGEQIFVGIQDDCSIEWGQWSGWDYQFEDIPVVYGDITSIEIDGDDVFDLTATQADYPNQLQGPFVSKLLDDPVSFRDLSVFRVNLVRKVDLAEDCGELHVMLVDTSNRPVVDFVMDDMNTNDNKFAVRVRFVKWDGTFVTLELVSDVITDWNGEIDLRIDDTGLIVDFEGQPYPLIGINQIPLELSMEKIAVQYAGLCHNGIVEDADLYLSHVSLWRRTGPVSIDLNVARDRRSGPDDVPLSRPGPSNEIQLFPANGEPLKFVIDVNPWTAGWLYYDIRPVAFSAPTSMAWIDIHLNGILEYSESIDELPTKTSPTISYLRSVRFDVYYEEEFEFDFYVHGTDWDNGDVVAFRGVWYIEYDVETTQLEVDQVFPESGELTYYIPMGEETDLDLGWLASSGSIDVSIDGIAKSYSNPTNIQLGNFPRNALQRLDLKFTGSGECILYKMHTRFNWLELVVDWVFHPNVQTQPAESDLQNLKDYYFDYTHGKLEYILHENPILGYEGQIDWTDAQIKDLGQDVFASNGAATPQYLLTHAWVVVVNDVKDSPSYASCRNYGDGTIETKWMEWAYTCLERDLGPLYHEVGHIAHMHEGYENSGDGEICELNCWMHHGVVQCYCEFHWYQTFRNTLTGKTWFVKWYLT